MHHSDIIKRVLVAIIKLNEWASTGSSLEGNLLAEHVYVNPDRHRLSISRPYVLLNSLAYHTNLSTILLYSFILHQSLRYGIVIP